MEKFSLKPLEEEVDIDGEVYVLRQMSEGDSIEYQEFMAEGTTTVDPDSGKPTNLPKNFSQWDAVYLSKSIHKGGNKVPLETIKLWPHHVVEALAVKARTLNPRPTSAAVKNSPSAGTGTSS